MGSQLKISIDHDGEGYTNEEFDTFEKNSIGLGLTSIKSRAIILGSELKFRKIEGTPKIEIITPFVSK